MSLQKQGGMFSGCVSILRVYRVREVFGDTENTQQVHREL